MIVDVGDQSIEEIARKYRQSAGKILADNGIEKIRPGMRLVVEGEITWVVGPYDTVESIAAEWSVDPEDIARSNKTPLAVGQIIKFRI